VDLVDAITEKCPDGPTQHSCLRDFYTGLLSPPEGRQIEYPVAGLTVGIHWSKISTSADLNLMIDGQEQYAFSGNDWSWGDDVFAAVAAANRHQTVQFVITPGFDSPLWVKSQLRSCDPLFGKHPPAKLTCGKVTFPRYPQKAHADDGDDLPLPWNDYYQEQWLAFLQQFRDQYWSHTEWVALTLAGPSGASPEMIFPTNESVKRKEVGAYYADDMWRILLQNTFGGVDNTKLDNDEAIVAHWKTVIDRYNTIFQPRPTDGFNGLTLILVPDADIYYPNFGSTTPPHSNPLEATDCANTTTPLSCEAKTDVITYFRNHPAPASATQVGGLKAASPLQAGSIGIVGVKLLTVAPSRFLGGATFDHPVSGDKVKASGSTQMKEVGCPSGLNNCTVTPEEAAYNVLAAFFDQTSEFIFWEVNLAGSHRTKDHQPRPGGYLMQYLNVPYPDIIYAKANLCPASPDFVGTSNLALNAYTSVIDLLNHASYGLLNMAGKNPTWPTVTCPNPPK
jgi:hypothetical protein